MNCDQSFELDSSEDLSLGQIDKVLSFLFQQKMNCVQPFELESSEDLGEIPSSVNIIEIEDESLDDEKLEKSKMSENLSDNSNFELSEVNLNDKKQGFTGKIWQDCSEDSFDIKNVLKNDEKLKLTESFKNNKTDFYKTIKKIKGDNSCLPEKLIGNDKRIYKNEQVLNGFADDAEILGKINEEDERFEKEHLWKSREFVENP